MVERMIESVLSMLVQMELNFGIRAALDGFRRPWAGDLVLDIIHLHVSMCFMSLYHAARITVLWVTALGGTRKERIESNGSPSPRY